MAKGSIAKDNLIKRFQDAAGADYAGTEDGKKFYFWSTENGERVQVAITMTVPKTPFAGGGVATPAASNEIHFGGAGARTAAATQTEMSEDEQATLKKLMEELGL